MNQIPESHRDPILVRQALEGLLHGAVELRIGAVDNLLGTLDHAHVGRPALHLVAAGVPGKALGRAAVHRHHVDVRLSVVLAGEGYPLPVHLIGLRVETRRVYAYPDRRYVVLTGPMEHEQSTGTVVEGAIETLSSRTQDIPAPTRLRNRMGNVPLPQA